MNGVINLYKVAGMSSGEAVECVRKILNTKSVGHMGTLDPLAEGVLPIGVGKCTRLFDLYLTKDKRYIATFQFGFLTDTLDSLGIVTAQNDYIPSLQQLQSAAKTMVGKTLQVPPQFSAKHVNGVRAYELARLGNTVELAPVEVELFDILVSDTGRLGEFIVQIHTSASYYVRSLCRDLSAAVGGLATMTKLLRVSAGAFSVENSITLQQLRQLRESALIPPQDALSGIERLDLDESLYEDLIHGRKIYLSAKNYVALYCKNILFGVAKSDENGVLKIKAYLKED